MTITMIDSLKDFIFAIPKAELHLHIEGTLEPRMMLDLAGRNGVELPYRTVQDVRAAYKFKNLQSFLDIYYQGTTVLQHEQDFYDLTRAYLKKADEQNVRHVEIFFDPQTHTERDIAFETVINGIHNAVTDARNQFGITSKLIMCFLRHLGAEQAFEVLEQSLPHRAKIIGVGLDSTEAGHPPRKFQNVFDEAHTHGYLSVAHAGEEGPPDYIRQALDLLKPQRIDHGVRCLEDEVLVSRLVEERIPLTVCPLSNIKLCVFNTIDDHNLKQLMDRGLIVTVNSDDPAYFGGYVAENLLAVQQAFDLSRSEIYQLARNSFEASFLDAVEKQERLAELDEWIAANASQA